MAVVLRPFVASGRIPNRYCIPYRRRHRLDWLHAVVWTTEDRKPCPDSSWASGRRGLKNASKNRAAISDADQMERIPACEGFYSALQARGSPRSVASFLSICLGGARQNRRLPRAIRPAGPRPWEQSRGPGIREEGPGETTKLGGIRRSGQEQSDSTATDFGERSGQ